MFLGFGLLFFIWVDVQGKSVGLGGGRFSEEGRAPGEDLVGSGGMFNGPMVSLEECATKPRRSSLA